MIRLALVAAVLFLSTTALARNINGQWANIDPDLSQWFANLRQPDAPERSCCGEADAYYADSFEMTPDGRYLAIITDDRVNPNRPYVPVGTKVEIPNHKIKFDQGNPTGHGIVFMSVVNPGPDAQAGIVYCYVTPGGV